MMPKTMLKTGPKMMLETILKTIVKTILKMMLQMQYIHRTSDQSINTSGSLVALRHI